MNRNSITNQRIALENITGISLNNFRDLLDLTFPNDFEKQGSIQDMIAEAIDKVITINLLERLLTITDCKKELLFDRLHSAQWFDWHCYKNSAKNTNVDFNKMMYYKDDAVNDNNYCSTEIEKLVIAKLHLKPDLKFYIGRTNSAQRTHNLVKNLDLKYMYIFAASPNAKFIYYLEENLTVEFVDKYQHNAVLVDNSLSNKKGTTLHYLYVLINA